MKIGTIIVFGVSGVGKTTACKAVVRIHSDVIYISASQLLRDLTRTTANSLRTSDAHQILENQRLLGQAFSSRMQQGGAEDAIIDAHSVIDNDKELVPVPVDTIASLNPSGIILLENDPTEIIRRRMLGNRPRPRRSLDQVTFEIDTARRIVLGYVTHLQVEFSIVRLSKPDDLENAINSVAIRAGFPGFERVK